MNITPDLTKFFSFQGYSVIVVSTNSFGDIEEICLIDVIHSLRASLRVSLDALGTEIAYLDQAGRSFPEARDICRKLIIQRRKLMSLE